DAALTLASNEPDYEADPAAKINGIRVWYSSFSSIDWLHDAVKDHVRFSRLRRRKSLRAWIRLMIDKSIGWWIVTFVGFLAAVVAFLVVRSEQWLFDSKEGYCLEGWWKAKRFCCPALSDSLPLQHNPEECASWRTWAQIFGWTMGKGSWSDVEREFV